MRPMPEDFPFKGDFAEARGGRTREQRGGVQVRGVRRDIREELQPEKSYDNGPRRKDLPLFVMPLGFQLRSSPGLAPKNETF